MKLAASVVDARGAPLFKDVYAYSTELTGAFAGYHFFSLETPGEPLLVLPGTYELIVAP